MKAMVLSTSSISPWRQFLPSTAEMDAISGPMLAYAFHHVRQINGRNTYCQLQRRGPARGGAAAGVPERAVQALRLHQHGIPSLSAADLVFLLRIYPPILAKFSEGVKSDLAGRTALDRSLEFRLRWSRQDRQAGFADARCGLRPWRPFGSYLVIEFEGKEILNSQWQQQ